MSTMSQQNSSGSVHSLSNFIWRALAPSQPQIWDWPASGIPWPVPWPLAPASRDSAVHAPNWYSNNFKYGKVRKILEERLERYAILPVLILKPKYGQPPAHQLWRCGKAAPRFRMRGPCWASTSQQCGGNQTIKDDDMIWYDMIWYYMIWYDMICVWIWCISPI